MIKFFRKENRGFPNRKYKDIAVGGLNISRDTIVATASGVTFDVSLLDNYDTFTVDQTSADTDKIIIPDSIEVGEVIKFIASDVVDLESESGGDAGFNGGSAGEDFSLPAGSLTVLTKISDSNILVTQTIADGTVSGPTSA